MATDGDEGVYFADLLGLKDVQKLPLRYLAMLVQFASEPEKDLLTKVCID